MRMKALTFIIVLIAVLGSPLAVSAGWRGEQPGDYTDHESRYDMNDRQRNEYDRQREYRKWERGEKRRAKQASRREIKRQRQALKKPEKKKADTIVDVEPVSLEIK